MFAAPTNCNQADYGNKNIQNTGLYDGNNKDEIYNTVLNSAGISIGGQTVYKSDSDSCTSSDQLGCWFRGNAVTVLATMWRYRDATKVTTYYFYQYTAWSDWSTEPAYASNVREVQVKQ